LNILCLLVVVVVDLIFQVPAAQVEVLVVI
jgi:hypothetical protein